MKHSIKNLVLISLVFLFLPWLPAGCANAQAGDILTDKAMLAQLGKLYDKKFSEDDVCIKRPKESAKIVVIGLKGEDSVCRYNGVFVDSFYLVKDGIETSKSALQALGWEKANEQARQKLTKLWVEKVIFAFSAQSNRTFRAVPIDNDGIKVIVSLRLPPGVTSRNAPKIFVFDKDGNMSSASSY